MRKLFLLFVAVLVGAMVLSGCGPVPGKMKPRSNQADTPTPIEQTEFDVDYIKLGKGQVVTCITKYYTRKSNVTSCFNGKQDVDDAISYEDSGYKFSFLLVDGQKLVCLEQGSDYNLYDTNCVPYLN